MTENKHMKDVLETNEQLKETIKELELENAKHIGDGEWDIRDITYRHGKFRLEEWGNRYHQFYDDDKALEDEEVVSLLFENEHYKKEYLNLIKKYEKLHDKLYAKDTFEVEPAGEYTEDSRTFKNGLCVYNNRLGFAYSVTEIVEVLNSLVEYKDLVSNLFDERIESLENELDRAVNAGMGTSILYEEIEELENLKEECMRLWYK